MKHVGIQGLTGLVLNPALVWISPETDPEVHVQVLYSGGKRIKRKGDGGEGSQERLSYQASDLSGQLAFNPKGRVWETEWNTSSRMPVSV